MKTRNQEQTEIAATIATFPATFGLRGFPGDTFRVSPMSSYFSGDTMYLYTERLAESGMWQSFAKGTVGELRAEITHRCTCGEGNLPGLAHCEHCPANHVPSVAAVATVAANDKPATNPEVNMNGCTVIARTHEAIYIRLPRAAWQVTPGFSKCSCGHCDGIGYWDTLVVPIKADPRSNDFTCTVHMPDKSIAGFLLHVATKGGN